MPPEIELNGKKKTNGFITKIAACSALIIFILGVVWRAGAWAAGIGAAVQAAKDQNIKQDSCIAAIQTTNDRILYLLTVQQIKDSLIAPKTLDQAKAIADSQALYNAQHPDK